jgi:hypothetical protein
MRNDANTLDQLPDPTALRLLLSLSEGVQPRTRARTLAPVVSTSRISLQISGCRP